MVDTKSKIQLSYLNSKPHGGEILMDLIDRAIGVRFYPPLGSEYYKLLRLAKFHGCTHINDNHSMHDQKKIAWIL